MPLKHLFVRSTLGLYFIYLFFSIYILQPTLVHTFGSFDPAIFLAGVAVSFYFALKRRSMVAPILLWAWMFIFVQMNPLAKEIHFDYIGWMLLYFLLYSITERNEESQKLFLRAALLTFGASYTASGLIKWFSPTWQSGEVLSAIHEKGFFLPWTEWFIESLDLTQWASFAKFTSLLEISALPLILYSRTRFFIWILLTLMQILLLLSTRINHISVVMLIFHTLCFDPSWLERRDRK